MMAFQRVATLVLILLWYGPTVAVAQSAAPAVIAAPSLTPEQMEQFLLNARFVSLKTVRQGVTGTRRATFTDGQLTHDVQIQTIDESRATFETPKGVELDFKDTFRYNIAAYRLAVMLGLDNVPMSVARPFQGAPAAHTWWLDDVMFDEGGRLKAKSTGPDPQRFASFVHIQRVFDQLIDNTDRNIGNSLWTRDWKMWMVDHTRAFRRSTELRNPARLERVDRGLLTALRGLTAASVKAAVGDSLTELEIDPLIVRAGLIVALFDKKIAATSEARVLYTKR
ncbi:MAG: hypothetical protein ABL986_13110 [Vicinamibacterales bacterium]